MISRINRFVVVQDVIKGGTEGGELHAEETRGGRGQDS